MRTSKKLLTAVPPIDAETLNGHRPKKVFESKQAIIFDDFLPDDIYQRVSRFAARMDYEHINTKGKIARAWHIHDGFPLRSILDLIYFADENSKPKEGYSYPTGEELDLFTDHLLAIQPAVEQMIGKKGLGGWEVFSVASWIYPPGTGLTMHHDGRGYAGAFVYYLNPVWRSHWGGMLLLADEEMNRAVHDYRETRDEKDFYGMKWLNANDEIEERMMEFGFAKCVFPKKNRIVFLHSQAYHMVTRVNEAAGDNPRRSLAGFFLERNPIAIRQQSAEGGKSKDF
jgi:Rps23 Pro-64 3,4-dihydroxylase Tpa1-like proline 4-hydroxylase